MAKAELSALGSGVTVAAEVHLLGIVDRHRDPTSIGPQAMKQLLGSSLARFK
jgi:hypothetical protein